MPVFVRSADRAAETHKWVDPRILTVPRLPGLVLDVIGHLIGERKGRLNSLEVIGKRIAYALANKEEQIVVGGRRPCDSA